MSQVDQKRAFNKLKHDLESWRGLIVCLSCILKWEKKFYPAVVFGIVSVVFLILWIMDLSVLTLLSLGALHIAIFDYSYPIIAKFFFNPENWKGEHETKFEEACTEVYAIKMRISSWYEFLFTIKEKKSTMFFVSVTILLLTCAWIGNVIDNLLLTYLLTTSLLLYPGIQHQGMIETVKKQFGCKLYSKIQQVKNKSSKTD